MTRPAQQAPAPARAVEKTPDRPLPLRAHLAELRARVLAAFAFFAVAFALCYTFRDVIYDVFTAPLADALAARGAKPSLIFTAPAEAFTSTLSMVFSAALALSIPFAAVEAWLFVSPALYADERRPALAMFLLTPLLFFAGVAFCYFFILPVALGFMITFVDPAEVDAPLVLYARISEYLELTRSLLVAFGLGFLFPLALLVLNRAGLVRRDQLRAARKYAVVLIFLVAAILTPPDIASQILLAIPLVAMYELAILLSKREAL